MCLLLLSMLHLFWWYLIPKKTKPMSYQVHTSHVSVCSPHHPRLRPYKHAALRAFHPFTSSARPSLYVEMGHLAHNEGFIQVYWNLNTGAHNERLFIPSYKAGCLGGGDTKFDLVTCAWSSQWRVIKHQCGGSPPLGSTFPPPQPESRVEGSQSDYYHKGIESIVSSTGRCYFVKSSGTLSPTVLARLTYVVSRPSPLITSSVVEFLDLCEGSGWEVKGIYYTHIWIGKRVCHKLVTTWAGDIGRSFWIRDWRGGWAGGGGGGDYDS